jgi:signal transduction histidine kinase
MRVLTQRTLRARFAWVFALTVALALLVFAGAVFSLIVYDVWKEAKAGVVIPGIDPYDDVKRALWAFALVFPAAVLGAGALGWRLARWAVAPLREASTRAREAHASELNLTLPTRGSDDEWDELATVLNQVIADARGSLLRIRQFTADAAHELRTPLTTIIGEAELALRRERPAEELRRCIETIRSESVRMARMVESLLTLARADTRNLVIPSQEVDLIELARAEATRAGRQRSEIALDVSGGSAPVRGDPVLLSRAIGNLVENAMRHARQRVEVRVELDDGEARVSVRDDGPGVPIDARERIFERFVQLDSARNNEGFGLGLPIVRAIADAHHGRIAVEGEGPGARFVLRLPSRTVVAGPAQPA